MRKRSLFLALLLAALFGAHASPVRAQTAPQYVFCINSLSTLCNTTTNPGDGTQGDDAWLAFGKFNLDIAALQPPATPYSVVYANGNSFAGLLPGSTGTWCMHWTNLTSAPTLVSCGAGVTITGTTPAAGNLTGFSGSSSLSVVNLAGDCTTSNTLFTTCLQTNGVSFAPSATTDTTNASHITSGTLPCAQTPALTGSVVTTAGNCTTAPPAPAVLTAPYTTTIGDCNGTLHNSDASPNTFTIATNASVPCPLNSQMTIVNLGGSGSMQITSSDTLKLVPTGTNGPITLTPFGVAQLKKINSTTWYVSGGSSGTSSGTTLLAYIKTLGINKAGVLTGQYLSPYSSTPLDSINTSITTWAGNPTVGVGSSQIASGYLPAMIDVFAACVGNIIGITNIGGGGCNIEDGQNTTANSWLALAQGAQAKNLIVKVVWTPNNPAGSGNNPWTIVTGGQPAVLTSGNSVNTTFNGWLDNLATDLKTLTQPFIFEAPGELNLTGNLTTGNWMAINAASTGSPTSAQVAATFNYIYNRLQADGVTNDLISWGYASGTANTSDQSSDGFGFPGAASVDLIAMDTNLATYTNASDYLWWKNGYPQSTLPFFIGSIVNSFAGTAFTENTYSDANTILGYMVSNSDGVNGYPAAFAINEWATQAGAIYASYNQQNNAVSALSGPTLAGSANYLNNTNLPVGGFSGPK